MNIQGFLLLMALFSTSVFAQTPASQKVMSGALVDRIEAIVNKRAIFMSDVKKFRELSGLRLKVDPLFANDPLSKKMASDQEVVDFLIAENLILEKFPVSDSDLEMEINNIQNNLRINREGLIGAISREGYDFEDYRQLMKASVSKRQLIDREIRNKASVSEDELKTEYNSNRSADKKFEGSLHLHLIKITKKNYKTPKFAKELHDAALADLGKGTAFDEVAKKTSDDSSASNGGDLGFLSYQDMNLSLQREVQKTLSKKVGQGTNIGSFEDSASFTIFRISEISADVDSGFNREKEQLRGKLLEKEFSHQVKLWIDRQRSLSFLSIPTASKQ
jgi:parvulin-like peptidyl-prolyl isomerase